MAQQEHLSDAIQSKLKALITDMTYGFGEVTVTCERENLKELISQLRTLRSFYFEQLIDVCAVDYLTYGHSSWETETASYQGFSRGVEPISIAWTEDQPRFAVVYHFLSLQNNQRVRVKTYLHEQSLFLPSVCDLFASANWFEREVYDLFGILFEDHPDLRRILTDYGFIGYPFRKDFPVSGHVEMRYDAKLQKVIYEPVDIEPRVMVPKVIRHDNRYLPETGEKP